MFLYKLVVEKRARPTTCGNISGSEGRSGDFENCSVSIQASRLHTVFSDLSSEDVMMSAWISGKLL